MATVYIEKIGRGFRRCRQVSYYLTLKKGGKRKRRYLPKRKVPAMMALIESRKKKSRTVKSPELMNGIHMEKSFYPKPLRFMLENLAGYSVRGSKLKRGKSFMTMDAAAARFAMLDRELREVVGTPENLLEICRKANSLLKRRNRMGIRTTYDECMQNITEENHVEKEEKQAVDIAP